MDTFPPPHRVLYEPLNDRETRALWTRYTTLHAAHADFEEVDAAVLKGMDDFAAWFSQWVTFVPRRPGVRCRILLVWHAQFLSLACQQMLRRSLEQRSFRCRVWFHIEEPTLQAAILSRCVVAVLPRYLHVPTLVGGTLDTRLWDDPRAVETDLKTAEA